MAAMIKGINGNSSAAATFTKWKDAARWRIGPLLSRFLYYYYYFFTSCVRNGTKPATVRQPPVYLKYRYATLHLAWRRLYQRGGYACVRRTLFTPPPVAPSITTVSPASPSRRQCCAVMSYAFRRRDRPCEPRF